MPKKVLELTADFIVKQDEDSEVLRISGWANTTDKDRANDVVLEEAWTKGGLNNYMLNPVILGYHKHDNPIGKMVDYNVSMKGLFITAEISKAAGNIYNLIKEGVLKSFSVGFRVKDADYDSMSDVFVVKDLELLEISVVSIPANQYSVFNVSKQFDSVEEYLEFKKSFVAEEESEEETIVSGSDNLDETEDKTKEVEAEEARLAEEAILAEEAKAVEEAETARLAEEEKAAEAAIAVAEKEALEKETSEENTENEISPQERQEMPEVVKTDAEKLLEEIEKRFEDKSKEFDQILTGLRDEIKDKDKELNAVIRSKMQFVSNEDYKVNTKEVDNAVLLSKIMGRGVTETKFAQGIITKAPTDHLANTTEDWEQEFSTRVMMDIRERLVVEPMFQGIQMTTNKMHIPVNPESGYAEWIAASAYNETAASTGTAQEHRVTDTTLTAYKLATREYIGYEEEEDSIIPLLPIIREAIIRRMAKSSDKALLIGTGASAANPIRGIAQVAIDATNTTDLSIGGGDKVTAKVLQNLRRDLGVRGIDPNDVVYIVNKSVYYDLLEDDEFRTEEKVGGVATALRGQLGSVNGSAVVVSGEFEEIAINAVAAIAVYRDNFLRGELRSLMMERDKNVEFQRNVLVASRRMGFIPIIDDAGASVLQYKA